MKEYKTIDKSKWGPGQWMEEPDKVQWTDEATGLPCLAVRNPTLGHWCGYVGVAPGHPLYRVQHDDDRVNVSVHGGPTFSDECQHGPEERSVCHVPEPGQPDNVWWFGFDCAHCGDLAPFMQDDGLHGGTYRTLAYVRVQCAQLAKQLQ